MCWNLFFNKVASWMSTTLLKRYLGTDIFLWNLRSFLEHLFEHLFLEHFLCLAKDQILIVDSQTQFTSNERKL